MWGGMWSSGRRGDDDPERRRCLKANAARKRSALRYTNRGLEPPPSLLRHETEKYDRARARLFSGAGSSSAAGSSSTAGSSAGASSSRSSLTPMKLGAGAASPIRAVKREPKADEEPPWRGGGVVGPEDFLPPAEADAIEAAILARGAWEEEEEAQRRRREDKIAAVLYEQGLAKSLAFDEKEEEWRRESIAQDKMYIDLTSYED